MDTQTPQKSIDQFGVLRLDTLSFSEIFQQVSGFIRRQLLIFLLIFACAIVLGSVYLFTAPPRYTAHVMLLIDSSKMRFLQQQQQAPLSEVPLDATQVDTQVEVLKSDNIALSVIDEQHLTENREFMNVGGGFIGAMVELVSGLLVSSQPGPESGSELKRSALAIFKSQRTVTRLARTYVLDISYTALSPHLAANLANAMADAYIYDQLESKYQATRRASTWLQQRIKELRQEASLADLAVIEYKEKNKIVDIDSSNPVGGASRLLGDQQLAELNTQLGAARAATAEAKAKLDRIQDVKKQGLPDSAVTDSLKNDVINRLRNQYLELTAREAILSARIGKYHLATVNLRNQINEISRSINSELSRIAESYKSDYEIAKARQEAVEQSYNKLIAAAQVTNRDRLGLRELESSAQVNHTIYQNFLQRYMEAIQQQSFPITEARVISPAAAPSQKSGPLATVILSIAGAIGLVLSFSAATLREAMDRVFRTSMQVEELLGTNCLSVLPAIKAKSIVSTTKAKSIVSTTKAKSTVSTTHSVGYAWKGPGTIDPERKISFADRELLRYAVNEPLSGFAEAFRAIKIAVDINGAIRQNKVIGITSTFPGEGKSTIASNLAALIADTGKLAILVDGDLRNPTLTRTLAPKATTGLLHVLSNKVDLPHALYNDTGTGLAFLPAVLESRLAHTNEILASEAFKRLLDRLRDSYDYIVVDLPPIAPVVDARATANAIDSFVFVIEWARTQSNAVQRKLAGAPEIYDRLLGAVLNKANVNVLERYENYKGKYYARYGYGYIGK
jgi:exopolysaccharide transport family protein